MPVQAAVSDDEEFSFPRLEVRRAQGCFLGFTVGQTAVRINRELRYQVRERASIEGDLWATIAFRDGSPWLSITSEPDETDKDHATVSDLDSEMRINSTALARLLCSRYVDEDQSGRLHYAYEREEQGPWTLFRLQEDEPEGWS